MRKTFTCLLPAILCSATAISQTVSRSVISTAGDFTENKHGITLSWTIGEVFCQTMSQDHHVTEGFQQGTMQMTPEPALPRPTILQPDWPTPHASPLAKDFTFVVFPNPAQEQLYVRLDSDNFRQIRVVIYDLSGAVVKMAGINPAATTQLDISDLKPATYLACAADGHTTISVSKFIVID